MRQYMPDDLTWEGAHQWWETEILRWESDFDKCLPLRSLSAHGDLNFQHRIAAVLAGLVEEDSRFGTLIANLQEPLSSRRPSLELLGRILLDTDLGKESDPWDVCGPLLSAAVATVTATGLVTGITPGTADISATSEGQTGSVTVTVSVP